MVTKMKKKLYEKPLIRAIQLKSHHFLLVGSSETEDINEQRDWGKEGGWS